MISSLGEEVGTEEVPAVPPVAARRRIGRAIALSKEAEYRTGPYAEHGKDEAAVDEETGHRGRAAA